MARDFYVVWWNVENLFDKAGQVEPHRPEYLQKTLKKELTGWTTAVLNKKISQLTKIIKQMNDGNGPDILGLCEIENKNVVDKLKAAIAIPGRNYKTVHHNMSDRRGIDIAFIYDANKFSLEPGTQFHHVIQMHKATRDLYQVSLLTKADGDHAGGNKLVLIGNHWPARMGDDNEFWRLSAGSTLGYWMNRIDETLGGDPAILVMGDFNDEPFSPSLVKHALSVQSKGKVSGASTKNYLWNAMWKPLGEGQTSYVFSGMLNMLDQFLLSRGLIKASAPIRYVEDSVKVLAFPEMTVGKYKAPRRFGRPSKPKQYKQNGYSDHFPIALVLQER